MKIPQLFCTRTLSAAALLALCAISLPQVSNAKDKDKGPSKGLAKGHDKDHGNGLAKGHHKDDDAQVRVEASRSGVVTRSTTSRGGDSRSGVTVVRNDDSRGSSSRYRPGTREYFESRPRTTFSVTLGDGYAGRGYYYGPANSPYYYQTSGVQYYRSRDLVPSSYWGGDGHRRSGSVGASVQRALAERGYYRGPIDGSIGRGSRSAIARFQEENGMRSTGEIDERLLRALRLD